MSLNVAKINLGLHRTRNASYLARALWGLLALIHVWPLAAVTVGLVANPSSKGATSLIILALLIALSTVKAMGLRVLRSDRPRTELLVWVLAGGLLHGGDLWRVDKVEFVPIAAGAGLGGGWIARRENRRRVVNLVQDLIVGIMAAVRTRATTRHLAGMLVEASVVHRTRWSCQRRTMRPPPVGV